jgi:hypothetical protein
MNDFAATLANRSADDRSATEFYPTPDDVTDALLGFLDLPKSTVIWECAAGQGHISKRLEHHGYRVVSTELLDRGYGEVGVDFLAAEKRGDFIITNPPFATSQQFIDKAMALGMPFAFLLKSQYWHAQKRAMLFFKRQPTAVLPLTWRPDFLFGSKGGAPTMECHWTVWSAEPATVTRYQPLMRRVGGGKQTKEKS